MAFLDIYSKNTEIQNFVKKSVEIPNFVKKNPLSGSRVFQRGNGKTDMPKPTVAFRNVANAPKNISSQHATTPSAAPQMIKL